MKSLSAKNHSASNRASLRRTRILYSTNSDHKNPLELELEKAVQAKWEQLTVMANSKDEKIQLSKELANRISILLEHSNE